MNLVNLSPSQTIEALADNRAAKLKQIALLCAVTVAAVGGAWIGTQISPPKPFFHPETALVNLVRFMALIKGAVALSAAGLTYWRFGLQNIKATRSRLAIIAICGCALMTLGAGIIGFSSAIATGALLFYGGLALFLYFNWRDERGIIAQRLLRSKNP